MTAAAGAPALRDRPWLTAPATRRVLGLLNRDGDEARIVGGAVRNALMGVAVGDIDVATTATPDIVMRRAAEAGIKVVPTGIAHGTVTLVVEGRPFEVTTLREDVETFGRRARVAFGRDWARDAQRRDFTVNALSVGPDGAVHDYTGGLADIAARRVRFIGDPDRRLAEDYLRILRFFRFHAAFGAGDADADGLAACIRQRAGLPTLSPERIRMEMMKLVVAPGAAAALRAMSEAGLLLAVLGGVDTGGAFAAMADAEARLALAPDAVRRLAALGVAVREDAARIAARLRLSKAEAARLDSMAHRWWRFAGLDDAQARPRLYRLGPARYRDRAMLACARAAPAQRPHLLALATLPERWSAPTFPLKAKDLIARGLKPGPALGRALAQAEDDWIAAGFPLEDETVAGIAAAAARAALAAGGPR